MSAKTTPRKPAAIGVATSVQSAFTKAMQAAVKADATMVASCKEAAKILSGEHDTGKPLDAELKRLKAIGRAMLAQKRVEAKPHVLATLDAALLIYLAAPVEVRIEGRGKAAPVRIIKSTEASTKAELQEAASTVREVHKMGRSTRGGKKAGKAAFDAVAVVKEHRAAIIAALESLGYTVAKARTTRKASAKAGTLAKQVRDLVVPQEAATA